MRSIHFWIFVAEFNLKSAKLDVGENANVGDDSPSVDEKMNDLLAAG
jgi:hypothetical protein